MDNKRFGRIDMNQPMSRREFLKATPYLASIVIGSIFIFRQELRQLAKDILHGTPLYDFLAKLEDQGLRAFGSPTDVTTYGYSESNPQMTVSPTEVDLKKVQNAQLAVDFFQQFPLVQTKTSSSHDNTTGIDFLSINLPKNIEGNKFIQTVLGTHMTTPNGESLPNNVLAMYVLFPSDARFVIAPAVPIPGGFSPNQMTKRYNQADYAALGLPNFFYSETFISEGHNGVDRQVIPNAERMQIEGKDIQGAEFARGAIENGTVYLTSDESSWQLAEWPDSILKRPNTGCARLFWNLNPRGGDGVNRVFTPMPTDFQVEQKMQLNGYVNNLVTSAEFEHVGPTCVFRTDTTTGQHDMIFIAPFLPLVAPQILKKILIETPVGTSKHQSSSRDLILAMPDAKYNTMYGSHPAILAHQNNVQRHAIDTLQYPIQDRKVTNVRAMNNSISFIVGKN